MDFLKAFQQAQEMGLTKEEFINVWKTESDYKLAMQGKGQVSHEAIDEERLQNRNRGVATDPNVNKITLGWQHEEEKRNGLPLNIEYICHQMVEKQEQHYQQMQQKYDQMMVEFRSRFEIITNHVSNVIDCNTESIKLQFMQELELLKQELGKVIKEQTVNHRSGVILLGGLSHHTGQSVEQTTAFQQNIPGYIESSTVTGLENNHKGKQHSKISDNVQTSLQLHDPLLQDVTDLDEQSITVNLQEGKTKSHINMTTAADQVNTGDYKVPISFNGLSVEAHSSFEYTLNKGSIQASVSYAEAVMKETKHTSRTSSVSSTSKSRSASVQSFKESMSVKSDDSCSGLPYGNQDFIMPINELVNVFMSPFMYSSGKPCKVRIHVEAIDKLIVRLHVSKGVYDDDHKWPLVLSGTGFILNNGSKKYTQIWQLQSVTCQKPISFVGEYVFPCAVCLVTSRSKVPDVTFNQLVERHYEDNNMISFKWTVLAKES